MEITNNLPTPDDIRALNAPADKFLCKLSDNWAKFRFKGFRIRDIGSNMVLVEVPEDDVENDNLEDSDNPNERLIKYHLGPDFLELKTVGLTMFFSVGE